MKNYNYFFASLFGFIPGFFILNTIGSGINKFIKETDEFNFISLILSREIYFPMIVFIILILSSIIIKKNYFDD